MRYFTLIFIGFLFFFSRHVIAQDQITLLNGKVFSAELINADSLYITYNFKKKKKVKLKSIPAELVFMIQYEEGNTDTIYYKNPEIDQHLTVREMELFIMGEQDAYTYHKSTWTAIFGVAFGTAGGYFLNESIAVAAVPLVYTVAAGISRVSPKKVGGRSSEVLSHPAYQEGYIKVARSKKAFSALGSSLAGTIIGFAIAYE